MDKTYSVYFVKATRKPVAIIEDVPYNKAVEEAELKYSAYSKLNGANMAANGVSVQIVDACHKEQIGKIQGGGLAFHNINVLYQLGSY